MITEIKEQFINNPEYIVTLLQQYGFANIAVRQNEIRCGFDETTNRTAIQIRLNDNPQLFVKDYVRDKSYDLFQYIIKVRNVKYNEVMSSVRAILSVEDLFFVQQKQSVFGGFYNNIRQIKGEYQNKTYDDTLLNQYVPISNKRFALDNIDIATQQHFQIGFDIISQRITIPIRDALGKLIGVKGRLNYESEDEPKYLYLIPCYMSKTLFGYSDNYEYIVNNTVYVYEAEKSVMQSYSYGIKNAVALGCNSLSPTQAKLLVELNPQRIVFMLDEGLDIEITKNNIRQLQKFSRFFDFEIGYWDYSLGKHKSKISPTDLGKETLIKIINEEIRYGVNE